MASFNLIDRPWIPCFRTDGTRDELSLRETLVQSPSIREIEGDSPLETASLLRLLLVLLHRTHRIESRADWHALWRDGRGEFDAGSVDAYFAKWRNRFDLFDAQRPFFQVADESQLGGRDPLNKMVHHIASDHAPTLFDHTLADDKAPILLTPSRAARAVLATQYFGLGYQKFVFAPCASGVNFFVRGSNLFETLLLNLYPKHVVEKAIPDSIEDKPVWESDTAYLERTTPNGLCDFWTWPNRRMKLFLDTSETAVERIAWAPGLRLKDDVTDPMQRWSADESGGWRQMRFSPDRALWRDSAALLELAPDATQLRPVAAVAWLSELARFDRRLCSRVYRLMALGMSVSRAEIVFLRAEVTPLSAELLQREPLLSDLSSALELAEGAGRRLTMGTFNLARLLLNPRISDQDTTDEKTVEKLRRAHDKSNDDEAKRVGALARSWGVEPDYWARLGLRFHTLVNDLAPNSDCAVRAWHQQVRLAALAAFRRAQVAVSGEPRAARALAVATNQFEEAIYRQLKTSEPSQETEGSNP